jgi:hypothetical protein
VRDKGWDYLEMPQAHQAAFDMPHAVAELLLEPI